MTSHSNKELDIMQSCLGLQGQDFMRKYIEMIIEFP